MTSHNQLLRTLTGPNDPLDLESLADYWLSQNLSAIAAIAMASMMDPVGTAYDLPPLRIVGFQTSESQILYQSRLHAAANAQCAKPVLEHALVAHISHLSEFCHAEFLRALATLEVTTIFQRDEFAYLGVREEQ